MLVDLYMLQFNNYYNRIVKRGGDTKDYYKNFMQYELLNTNFNPNDGVMTTHNVQAYDSQFDYVIVCDPNNDKIISKWFVLEAKRIRIGQYQLTLKRDNIAEKYDSIINSPCIIKRAIINDNNPLIYNNEDMSFNQIKTKETLLYPVIENETDDGEEIVKTDFKCAFIVGYYEPKEETQEETQDTYISGSIKVEPYYDFNIDKKYNDWVTAEGYEDFISDIQYISYDIAANYQTGSDGVVFNVSERGTTYMDSDRFSHFTISFADVNTISRDINNIMQPKLNEFNKEVKDLYNINLATEKYQNLLKYVNKIVRFSTDTTGIYEYRKIGYDTYGDIESRKLLPEDNLYKILGGENGYIAKNISDIEWDTRLPNNRDTFIINSQSINIMITSEIIQLDEIKYSIPTSVITTENAPYNIFAIPVSLNGNIIIKDKDGNSIASGCSYNVGMQIAMDISKKYTGTNGKVYDLQLLPYFPYNDKIIKATSSKDNIEITIDLDGKYWSPITISNSTTNISCFFNIQNSSFSFNIPHIIDITNKKIQNECDMYRLCSPNWNGQFEFNASKNGGVRRINVDCTYKPYNPYIHLNPDFGELYGIDYNDARGLICNGDFGLPLTSSEWATFERNNANYQKTFNREIENLEVKQRQETINDVMGLIAGPVMGAAAGARTAGPIGAEIGFAVGGLTSMVAAGEHGALRAEAMDFKKDMFNFQLGNIKAIPNSLNRVSTFNYNNKIMPLIEYYTCTPKEKSILAYKIAWQSMSVNAVGNIAPYIQNKWEYSGIKSHGFVRAQLIRYIGTAIDNHEVEDIAKELNNGLFFEVEDEVEENV